MTLDRESQQALVPILPSGNSSDAFTLHRAKKGQNVWRLCWLPSTCGKAERAREVGPTRIGIEAQMTRDGTEPVPKRLATEVDVVRSRRVTLRQ